jgi:hypothetical protein
MIRPTRDPGTTPAHNMPITRDTADATLLTICAALIGIGVPVLEINATHVFNPAWPAHARLHEVWQLLTNSALAAAVAWMAWSPGKRVGAALLSLAVTGGFLIAYLLQGAYGGSMVHPDGSEKIALGVNVALLGFGFATLAAGHVGSRAFARPPVRWLVRGLSLALVAAAVVRDLAAR